MRRVVSQREVIVASCSSGDATTKRESIPLDQKSLQPLCQFQVITFYHRPKEWGADRERRKTTRREQKIHSSRNSSDENETTNVMVEHSEYESNLLNFLFSLRPSGVKLNEYKPHGQDMGMYANL